MGTTPWADMKIDLIAFRRNNERVPPEYLSRFAGRQIAWHADGTRVVADAATPEALNDRLRELGVPFDEVVYDFVDGCDGVL